MSETRTCPLCDTPTDQWSGVSQRSMIAMECKNCGRFRLTPQGRVAIERQLSPEQKRLLRGLTRRRYEGSAIPELTGTSVHELLGTLSAPRNPAAIADAVLQLIASRSRTFSSSIKLSHDVAIDLFLPDDKDLLVFLRELQARGLVESGQQSPIWTGSLTFKGWERVRELENAAPRGNRAFVAMSFSPELKYVWSDAIRPALESTGYEAVRVDHIEYNGKIDDRIIAELRLANLVVADFSEHKHGVYFEAGFAMGRNVPVIWVCRDSDIKSAHFDTRQYNHITWDSAEELRDKLVNRIRATVPLQGIGSADA